MQIIVGKNSSKLVDMNYQLAELSVFMTIWKIKILRAVWSYQLLNSSANAAV